MNTFRAGKIVDNTNWEDKCVLILVERTWLQLPKLLATRKKAVTASGRSLGRVPQSEVSGAGASCSSAL